MNTVETNVIVAVVIGFVVGAALVWLLNRSNKDRKTEEYSKLQAEFDQYRAQVNAHFAKTADSIDELTKSYQQVFDHLSDGAQHLMDKKALQEQLEKRQGKAVTLAYLVEQDEEGKEVSSKPRVSKITASSMVDSPKQPKTGETPAHDVEKKDTSEATDNTDKKPNALAQSHDDKMTASFEQTEKSTPAVDKDNNKQPNTHAKSSVDTQAAKPQSEKQGSTVEKSNAHQTTETAGRKLTNADEHDTAVNSVKKHIKDDKGTK